MEAATKKAKKTAVATKRHNTRSATAIGSSSLDPPDPPLTQCDTSTPVSAGSTSSLSLPGPSSVTASRESDMSPQNTNCECSYCFEMYCHDGKEWLECACGRWVHELCIEEVRDFADSVLISTPYHGFFSFFRM